MPKSKLRIILGIDPGIADTGFGVITQAGNELTMIDYGSIKTKAGLPLPDRLFDLHQSLETLIATYKPTYIAVEKLFFCKNVKTALTVGHARGVVLLTAGRHDLTLTEFTPLQIKQALTSYGQADKKQVQQMVKIVLGLSTPPKSDDAADALACAICCAHSLVR